MVLGESADCQSQTWRLDGCHVNGLRILARIIARSHLAEQQGRHPENIKHMSGELAVDDVQGESLDEKNKGEGRGQ
jgi:hypothetical protein